MDPESQLAAEVDELEAVNENLHRQYGQALKDFSDRQSEVWEQDHMLLAQVRELENRLPKKPTEGNSEKLTALRREIGTLRVTRDMKKRAKMPKNLQSLKLELKSFVTDKDLSAEAKEVERIEKKLPELLVLYSDIERCLELMEKELKAKKDKCGELYKKLLPLPSRASLVKELENRAEQKAELVKEKNGILEKLEKLGTLEKLQKLEEAKRKKQEEKEELTKTVEKLKVEWEAFGYSLSWTLVDDDDEEEESELNREDDEELTKTVEGEMAVLTDERQSQAVSPALTDDNQAGTP